MKKRRLAAPQIGNGIRSIPGLNLQPIFPSGNSTKIDKITYVTDFIRSLA